jgi:meiotically up-regulated gene 157 (Mug157) protein
MAGLILWCSDNYYNATGDIDFFKKYQWVDAVKSVLAVADNMTEPTYADDGSVNALSYSWTRETDRATETTANGMYSR